MNIELRRFFEGDAIRQDFDYEFSAEDELFSSPVRVTGFVKNSAGIVSLEAQACFSVSTQCAKCARDITQKLQIPVNHFLVAHLNDENQDEYILVENMALNLDELVLEDIYLSFPFRFLCKDDCKGLCPYCGKDLNEGVCGCKKPMDPRLSPLQQLLDNTNH